MDRLRDAAAEGDLSASSKVLGRSRRPVVGRAAYGELLSQDSDHCVPLWVSYCSAPLEPEWCKRDVMVDAMFEFDDLQLEAMRVEPKRVLSGRAREVAKRGHFERNYDAVSVSDDTHRYRIFVRQSRFELSAFSAGLLRIFHSGESLILTRYNGPYHSHRNRLEGTRLGAMCHRHVAKASYMLQGMDPDGFAEPDQRFDTAESALRCLLGDCNVDGLDLPPHQSELF